MDIVVEIAKDSQKWDEYPEINSELFAKVAEQAVSYRPKIAQTKQIELSILLTEDEEMRRLNLDFRRKDKPTNVLSFPDLEKENYEKIEFKLNENYIYLGDVAFGYDIIRKEASEKSIDFKNHFIHLCTHGILHLIGFDHENEDEATIMEEIEIKILKTFGIKSPY